MASIFRFIHAALLLPGLTAASAVAAQDKTVDAAASAPTADEGFIEGFRSARFGMAEAELRDAVARDFSIAPSSIARAENPAEGTTALIIHLPQLSPGPGPASVVYILGAASKRLAHINVAWTTNQPSAEQRLDYAAAGVALSNYLRQQSAQPRSVGAERPTGKNSVLMYVASDSHGAALEVTVDGIAFERTDAKGEKTASQTPSGPATLRLTYIANALNPDVLPLRPGAF